MLVSILDDYNIKKTLMPGAAATVGSMHVCPMVTVLVPHVGGPVVGPGVPTVLIGGKPAAVMGDMCVCVGPPDVIAQGEATVLIGGKPAATVGAMTAHGGVITMGEPTVLIGTGAGAATAVMAVDKIPFPTIDFKQKTLASLSGNSASLKEAATNQQALREASENNDGEPKIYNLQWLKEDQITKESKLLKEVTLRASVLNIPDGETITLKVKKRIETTNENEENEQGEEELVELTGTVKDKMVEVNWVVELPSEEQEG